MSIPFYACEGEYKLQLVNPLSSPGGMALRKVWFAPRLPAKSWLFEVFFCKESSVDLVETWLCTLEPFFEHVALGNLATKN